MNGGADDGAGHSPLRRLFGGGMKLLPRWLTDLDWRILSLVVPVFFVFLFIAITFSPSNPFSTFAPLRSFFLIDDGSSSSSAAAEAGEANYTAVRGRIAVCLVGGARRFELTGPSIIERVLKVHPGADLFLHSPYDKDSFKFLLLKNAPSIAWVRIFRPRTLPETEPELRVLTSSGSPNGIQGLLQYFNLVEGCLTMIKAYQEQKNITYDWILRTRVDGYWNAPLGPQFFVPGKYLVPPGSSYGGLNDRLGIGDMNTSITALSRLSLIPELDVAGYRGLNSETSFRAQLITKKVSYLTKRLPFCIVSDRRYEFPPAYYGVPVAAMSSPGPLSGAKCRPCRVACRDKCVEEVMNGLNHGWSWTDWEKGTLQLCDAHGEWESGWEKIFDQMAGRRLAAQRKRVWSLNESQCLKELEEMRRRCAVWETPALDEICKLGLGKTR